MAAPTAAATAAATAMVMYERGAVAFAVVERGGAVAATAPECTLVHATCHRQTKWGVPPPLHRGRRVRLRRRCAAAPLRDGGHRR